jgi:hypothetical protein
VPFNKIDRKKYNSKKSLERRTWLDEYKLSAGCAICGYNKHPRALTFDHLDPSEKHEKFSSKQMLRWGEETLMEELKKCRVLCANCHNIETHENEHSGIRKQPL